MASEKLHGIEVIRGEDSADVLIYDFIGEVTDYFTGEKMGISSKGIVKAISDLEKEYDNINLRINSPGGSMADGNAIISAMKKSSATITTHNDGIAASMAAVIFMASDDRSMASNALLMLHSPSSYLGFGNAVAARTAADRLDKFEETALTVIAENTGFDKEEIKSKWFDGEDHWLTADDVTDFGLITGPSEDSEAAPGESVATMTYGEVVNMFATKKATPTKDSIFKNFTNQITSAVTEKIGAFMTTRAAKEDKPQKTISEMNLEEFKTSLANGELNAEEVTAHLASLQPAENVVRAEPRTEAQADPTEPEVAETADIIAQMKADFEKQLNDVKAEFEAFKKAPGAEPTASLSEGDHYTEDEKAQAAMKAEFAEKAEKMSKANY